MKRLSIFLSLAISVGLANAQTIKVVEQNKPCSIRGLSVVNDNVAWLSGSKGHVAMSTNAGTNWVWQQIKGYEQRDFRDIEAFSDKEAVIMSSGTPALILKTTDGGQNWKEVFRNNDKADFLDAMAFANSKHGFALGDPIDGKFLLLETKNGGETWNKYPVQPAALPGEAAFAASGTCLTTNNDGIVTIVTGGNTARKITISGNKTNVIKIPLAQGKAAAGIFSAARGGGLEVFVGGNYEQNTRTDSVACYLSVSMKASNPQIANRQPAGYQSCVIFLKGNTFVSTGTPGSNITLDGGHNWQPFDTTSYNVCQKAKQGNLILFAGDRGKIGILQL